MILILVVSALVSLLIVAVGSYNRLASLQVLTDEAWSGIDVQLKRRYDLVPNLVEVVKGYAKHEEGLFLKVTQARTMAIGAQSVDGKAQAEAGFSGALKSLFAVAESYPELKANTNFLELHKSLNDIENDIQLARRYYNGVVRELNTKIVVLPTSLIAFVMGFKARPYFEVSQGAERENQQIKF